MEEEVSNTKSGNWSDPTVWTSGQVPNAGSHVVINANTFVVYDLTTSDVRGVTVNAGGALTFDPSRTVQLQSSANVIVEGTLSMRPANSGVTHTLRFINVNEANYVGGGLDPLATDVGLWMVGAGKLDAVGASKTSWTRVAGSVNQGETSITLEAAPSGWQVGDEISIAPTELPSVGDAAWSGFDLRTITSINGATIGLSAGTSRPHPMVNNTWRAEVMNLTRNVRIEGTATGRSHIFIRTTVAQNIHYVAIRYMGPRKDGDIVLGRYGLHFHHNGDSQVGTVVDGVVIRDYGSHAFVPHASNGITFRDDISHTGPLQGYWWDLPASPTERNASSNITYDHSIAADIQADSNADGFHTASGFSLGEGDGNQLLGSVAVGVRGGATSSGFHWPSQVGELTGVWNFTNNIAHNNKNAGIFIWQNTNRVRHEPNENFVSYHNGDVGNDYGAYNDEFTFTNSVSFENGAGGIRLHAGGSEPGSETFFLGDLIIGSPNGILMPKHSAEGKKTIVRDCVMQNVSGKAVLVQESLRGIKVDFVRCTIEGRDLEASDFDIQLMMPTSVYRIQRRNNSAFQLTGPSGAVSVIPQFDFSTPGPSPTPIPTITIPPFPTPIPPTQVPPTPTRTPTPPPGGGGAFLCTQVIGFSQTSHWYTAGGSFESLVGNSNWQLLWESGSGLAWQDPNYQGWNNAIVSPCSSLSSNPDRVLLTISTPDYVSDVNWWVTNIRNTVATIRSKYSNVNQIILQPVVGGPNDGACFVGGTQVRATFNHPIIDQAIAQVVGGDVVAGMSPEVRTCSDYADSIGHFVSSARAAIGIIIGNYYAQSGPLPTQPPQPTTVPTATPIPPTQVPPTPTRTPTPTPPVGGGIIGPIGFIGCSNSRDTVQGYQAVGGGQFWQLIGNVYSGGSVVVWGNGVGSSSSPYWRDFNTMLSANPSTKNIWLSLCTHPADTDTANYNATLSIIGEVQRLIPDVTIYASALNGYVAPHVCSATGVDGPSRMQALVDRLAAEGRVRTGPDVGDLISIYQTPSAGATDANNETVSDGCHPNTTLGEPKLGRALLNFFSGVTLPSPTTPPGIPTPTPIVTSIATATPTKIPVPTTCKVLSAFWAGTTTVREGARVSLTVITNGLCNGKYLFFKVWERDGLGLIGADPVRINPPPALVRKSVATTTWIAEYQRDGAFGLGGGPEYFFVVQSAESRDTVTSRRPDLTVQQSSR